MTSSTDELTFLRFTDLKARRIVGDRKTIKVWIKKYGFPEPVELAPGGRSMAWRVVDIERWIQRRQQAG